MSDIRKELSWNAILNRLQGLGAKIEVPAKFKDQVNEIDGILANDKTGLISTIYEFMVATGNTDFNIITDNQNVTNLLKGWAKFEVNKNVNVDIPRGIRGVSEQFLRERWRSSFIIAKILWDEVDGYELPSSITLLESKNVEVVNENSLKSRTYSIPKNNDSKEIISDNNLMGASYIVRKPFNAWKDINVTPYLVKKGVLYNALLKTALKEKQADILEEIIPYLLILKAGDRNLVEQHLLGDLDNQLTKLKNSIRTYKRDHEYRAKKGDSIFKGRYDVELQHFLPELDKIFNEAVMRPIDLDMLYGLGLIELQGFGTRQEAIMNPKVLFEELTDAVGDLTEFYEEIIAQIIERNKTKHPKDMNRNIRIIPKPIKGILTDDIKKLIKDFANTGQLAIEDSFEALPNGFDYEVSKMRREQERENGAEDLFFPRVILNQDSNDYPTRPNTTPQEIPQKKKDKEDEEAKEEVVEAPYTKDNYPSQLKNLPVGARNLWIKTWNAVYKATGSEDKARQAAWSNVKKQYKKIKDKWVKKENASLKIIDDLSEEVKAVLTIPEQITLVKED